MKYHLYKKMKPEKKLLSSISSDIAKDLSEKLGEVGLDAILTDGVLREIPIIGTALTLLKAGNNIKAYLFTKKILAFLEEVESIEGTKRERLAVSLGISENELEVIGESLLFLLDSINNVDKCRMLGRVFVALVKNRIPREEFNRLCFVVDRVNPHILDKFVEWYDDSRHCKIVNVDILEELAACGLVTAKVISQLKNKKSKDLCVSYDRSYLGKLFFKHALAKKI